jgi:cytochrome P450
VPDGCTESAASPLFGLRHLLRLRTDQLGFYSEMRQRYGDAVRIRIGPHRIWLLFHPDEIAAVLAAYASSFVRFEPVMRVLAQWNGSSLLISEGERWHTRRRQVLPAFASRRLPGYGGRIVDQALALRAAWESAANDTGVTLDTDREMVKLTLDIAADSLFGERLGDRAAAVGEAVATLSEVAFRESTSPIPVPDWAPLAIKTRKRRAVATMEALVTGIVSARLAAPAEDRGDLLSTLIDGGMADPVAVRDEVMTLLIAGHETTSATLSWASHLLSQNAVVLDKVLDEIDRVIGGRPPRADDLRQLDLLRAVIDETLRLYPPAYTLFPRRATKDVVLNRLTIRAGEIAQLIPFITQRDPAWFAQPAAFRPARFLGEQSWPRYAYFPFGAGPRVCVGETFGLLEVGLVLATLLQRFSPMPVPGPVVPEPRFSLRPRGGLCQRWQLR